MLPLVARYNQPKGEGRREGKEKEERKKKKHRHLQTYI